MDFQLLVAKLINGDKYDAVKILEWLERDSGKEAVKRAILTFLDDWNSWREWQSALVPDPIPYHVLADPKSVEAVGRDYSIEVNELYWDKSKFPDDNFGALGALAQPMAKGFVHRYKYNSPVGHYMNVVTSILVDMKNAGPKCTAKKMSDLGMLFSVKQVNYMICHPDDFGLDHNKRFPNFFFIWNGVEVVGLSVVMGEDGRNVIRPFSLEIANVKICPSGSLIFLRSSEIQKIPDLTD